MTLTQFFDRLTGREAARLRRRMVYLTVEAERRKVEYGHQLDELEHQLRAARQEATAYRASEATIRRLAANIGVILPVRADS